MITCIIKLKTKERLLFDEETGEIYKIEPVLYSLTEVAREVWQLLGKGGNPNAPIVEEHVGFVNTSISNGYFRSLFDTEYLPYLEGIKEIDASDSVEIVSIEYEGQEMFQTGVIIDQDGVEQPDYLGMI